MKIKVVPRKFIEDMIENEEAFPYSANFISIFSSNDEEGKAFSPFMMDRYNILKLCFDDVTDSMTGNFIHFNEGHAQKIKTFIDQIQPKFMLYVHCDAGVSRSGAVGYVLNEYLNKYLENNSADYEWFNRNNKEIMPNPDIVRILKDTLFGKADYSKIFVNDYEFNEDGERIDHIHEI